jgi:hypothetical protein
MMMVMLIIVLSSFGVLGATVFAKPTVTEIEEVGCLMHSTNVVTSVL